MGKRFTYHATRIHDRVFFSYDDQGIRRHVEHQLPSQPVGDPQERTHFRNMSRKDRHKAIGNMMQPLLRPSVTTGASSCPTSTSHELLECP